MFNRDVYFEAVRSSLFSSAMTQQQVDGQNVILALWEHQDTGTPMTDTRWLAYMLSTTYKECDRKMWPVTEYGSDDYLHGKPYWPYIARGFVGLTWDYNYEKASAALGLIDDRNLVDHMEVALDSLIAARIMFRGMAEGWFTGKRLNDYFSETKDDPINARQIINGNDCDEEIAGYYEHFLEALDSSEIEEVEEGEGLGRVVTVHILAPKGIVVDVDINKGEEEITNYD